VQDHVFPCGRHTQIASHGHNRKENFAVRPWRLQHPRKQAMDDPVRERSLQLACPGAPTRATRGGLEPCARG